MNESNEIIVNFYLGSSTDNKSRGIEEVWSWGFEKLEGTHDYIQWLFPLQEKSQFNSNAPILSGDDVAVFRQSRVLLDRLKRSLRVMLNFYGLRLQESSGGAPTIERGSDFAARSVNWLKAKNHNYLRLTRILASIKILGLEDCCAALFMCLSDIYGEYAEVIGLETFRYWKRAAT